MFGAALFVASGALSGSVRAEITVKPTDRGYDIDITSEATASELVDAIASATGIDIKGEPAESTVGTNQLRNASLERALRQLLPKAPFVVRSDADGAPTAIIFLSPRKGDEQGADGSDDLGDGSIDADDPAVLPQDGGMEMAPMEPEPYDPGDTAPVDGGQ